MLPMSFGIATQVFVAPAREFNSNSAPSSIETATRPASSSSLISTSNSNHACIGALYPVAVSMVGKRPTDPGRSLNRTLILGPALHRSGLQGSDRFGVPRDLLPQMGRPSLLSGRWSGVQRFVCDWQAG